MNTSMRRRCSSSDRTSAGDSLSSLSHRSFMVSSLPVDTSLALSAVLPRIPCLVIAPSTPSPTPLHVLWLTFLVLSSTLLQSPSPFFSIQRFHNGSEVAYQKGQSMTTGAKKKPEPRSDGGTGDTHIEGCFRRYLHAPAGPVLQGICREANLYPRDDHSAGYLSTVFEDPR